MRGERLITPCNRKPPSFRDRDTKSSWCIPLYDSTGVKNRNAAPNVVNIIVTCSGLVIETRNSRFDRCVVYCFVKSTVELFVWMNIRYKYYFFLRIINAPVAAVVLQSYNAILQYYYYYVDTVRRLCGLQHGRMLITNDGGYIDWNSFFLLVVKIAYYYYYHRYYYYYTLRWVCVADSRTILMLSDTSNRRTTVQVPPIIMVECIIYTCLGGKICWRDGAKLVGVCVYDRGRVNCFDMIGMRVYLVPCYLLVAVTTNRQIIIITQVRVYICSMRP